MSPQDYILDIKTRFGEQSNKEGMLIRDMNDQELMRRMFKRYPGDKDKVIGYEEYLTPEQIPPSLPPTQTQSVFDKVTAGVTDAFKRRGAIVKEARRRSDVGEQTQFEGLGQAVGQAAGLVGDAGFEVLKNIFKPEIQEKIGEVAGGAVQNEPVQAAAQAYKQFKEAHPRAAADIEALINVGTVVPVGGLGVKGAVKGAELAAKGLSDVGKVVPEVVGGSVSAVKAGTQSIKDIARKVTGTPATREEFVRDLVLPQQTKGKGGSLTKNIRQGRVEEGEGLLEGRKVNPDDYQVSIEKEVSSIPHVDSRKSLLENSNAIYDEIGVTAKNLRSQLEAENPVMPRTEVDDFMNQAVKEIEESPVLVGDAGETAIRILNKFKTFLPEGDTITGIDLLDARQKLDKWMKSIKGEKALDPATESAVTIALRSVRQGANELLAHSATSVPVKELLRRQSLLYGAIENIAPKASKEGSTGLQQFLNSHPVVKTGLKYGAGLAGLAGAGAVGGVVSSVLGD